MKLNFLFILTFLVFTDAQVNQVDDNNTRKNRKAKKPKKWRPPLEFGPKTTGIYSSLQRSNRRKINVDLLDPYDDRTKPPRAKLSGTSFKPGTWNWYPNMDIPGYSYRFRIFNLTKDQAGSYMGMHDYRKNYGPLYNTRFGGTYPPIPPLLGDPRQPRLAWYLKKYAPPTPPANYIEHVMDTINDGQLRDRLYEKQLEPETRKQVSVEWYTVRPKNESNYFYEEDKVKPRFGDYGGIAIEDAFPAYKPKEPYEVVMVPERQPIYKRAPQWMLDKDRNIYNPRLSSKEMHERIKARERKPIRRNRRYNWHSRTHSDKYYDHLYHTTAQTTKKPSTSKKTKITYIPNVTVGNIPKDEMFYEKLFNPVTRVVGATRRTYIPNVRIMHMDLAQYTTPKNYMENYEIPITKVLGSRSSDKKADETKYRIHGSSEARKWLYGQQNDNVKTPENYMRPTIVPFKSHPNFKLHDQWVARPWATRRPRRARRTYLTRAPNATYRTLRNFESPVTWPDGHIEPPYDYSMTNKTYPPEYYDKLNASTYDDYNAVSHEGWVDSEYHRWHGQRAAGLPLESVDDDYYSEYANWYLKKRDNSSENRMFEVYDSKAPRPPRPTFRTRTQRRKKKYRGINDVSEVSEYERGMKKRLDETFKKMMNKILDTTDRTVYKRMDKYMKLLKNGSFTSDMLKNLPFKDFFPPESYFHTTTSEACDTSSMQRYFLHGRPGYPQKKESGKHTMARRMQSRRKQKIEMENYKKQLAEMRTEIDKLTKKKKKDRGLFRKLYGKRSLLRKLKVNFLRKKSNRNIVKTFKDKVRSIKNLFGFAFKKKTTTTVRPEDRIF